MVSANLKFKNMKNTNFILGLIIINLALLTNCKEEKIGPLYPSDSAPGIVTDVSVVNGPGKATISYTPPKDQDLLYVKAIYFLKNGKTYEAKASFYNNSLVVEGFGDTEEHKVKLYSVNRGEVASAAVETTVRPLENPIQGIFRSLNAVADFGGLSLSANNPTKSDVTIEVLQEKDGKYVPTRYNIYTSRDSIQNSIRGLESVPQKFAFTVRDRWLNYSDTLYSNLKPLFETALPKRDYKAITSLPTDAGPAYGLSLSNMWDGNTSDWPLIWISDPSILTPQWVTFDTGKLANLSRIVIWGYPQYLTAGRTYYIEGNLKDFEIWGSDNPPADGSFNNWVLLGKYNSTKPSGSGYGVQTTEDYDFARAGISYGFKPGLPKVRYLRIKSIKNWVGASYMYVGEIQVYGAP